MKIYLVRHGETDWNQAGLLQGQTDIALNAQGLEQAHDAAERLKKVPFEIAFCSPLIRAKRTAEIIIGDRKIIIVTPVFLSFKKEIPQLFQKAASSSSTFQRPQLLTSVHSLGNIPRYSHSQNRSSRRRITPRSSFVRITRPADWRTLFMPGIR